MSLSRRQLIKAAGGMAAAHTLLPAVGTIGKAFGQTSAHPDAAKRNRLVVLFLDGGNDGLNTVVPYATGAYYDARPTIAYRPEEVGPALASFVAHLPRMTDRAVTIRLGPLDEAAIGELVSDSGVAHAITEETDGTPLAVAEVVRELAAEAVSQHHLDVGARLHLDDRRQGPVPAEVAVAMVQGPHASSSPASP